MLVTTEQVSSIADSAGGLHLGNVKQSFGSFLESVKPDKGSVIFDPGYDSFIDFANFGLIFGG